MVCTPNLDFVHVFHFSISIVIRGFFFNTLNPLMHLYYFFPLHFVHESKKFLTFQNSDQTNGMAVE
jgi:hypothetical protein